MRMNQLRLKWFKKNNKPTKKRVMKKMDRNEVFIYTRKTGNTSTSESNIVYIYTFFFFCFKYYIQCCSSVSLSLHNISEKKN